MFPESPACLLFLYTMDMRAEFRRFPPPFGKGLFDMITGQLRFAPRYYGVHPRLQAAIEFLMRENLDRPAGAYEIDGRNIVALFQEYTTHAADIVPWETHDYHYDVQYLVAGEEKIGFGRRKGAKAIKPYNAQDDYDIIEPIEKPDYFTIRADSFAVLFPEDAHQPRVMSGAEMAVKKICIKVLV